MTSPVQHVFVTGATGFVGHHFRALIDTLPDWNLLAAPADFDLRDSTSIAATLAALPAAPDAVLHLAAQSNVPQAFADPETTLDINFQGTLRLLRALKKIDFRGRFVFIGTADAYGLVPDTLLPVSEDYPLRPRNPYAVSKAAAEALVFQWSQTEALDAVIARPFNHIGPGQDARFAVGGFARQLVEISRGLKPPRIEVGDLDVTRDFTDVRDVVRAYFALLTRGERGQVYNVGSGSEVRLADVLNRLIRFSNIEADIVADTQRMRPAEQRRMCADTRRIAQAIGWQCEYSLDRTLNDTLHYWKEKIGND